MLMVLMLDCRVRNHLVVHDRDVGFGECHDRLMRQAHECKEHGKGRAQPRLGGSRSHDGNVKMSNGRDNGMDKI